MNRVLIPIASLCLISAVAWGQSFEEAQSPVNGHYYSIVQPGDVDSGTGDFFTQMEAVAVSRGGHLATIRSAEENDWLANAMSGQIGRDLGLLLIQQEDIFIGFNDIDSEGDFVWTSGESVTYTNWAAGEPNDSGGAEDVTEMNIGPNDGPALGLWNDQGRDEENAAIVERIVLEFRADPGGSKLAEEGSSVALDAQVWGTTGQVTWTWTKDGSTVVDSGMGTGNIVDASLTLNNVTVADEGSYVLEVSDESKATVTSTPANVTVVPPGSLPAANIFGLAALVLALSFGIAFAFKRYARQ